MNKQIEQLIEKREIRNKNPYEETNINEFISDLKSLQDTTEEIEMLCPHCGYATIPFKVNKPSEPYGKSLQEPTEEKCKADTFRDDGGAYYNNMWE